MSTKTSREQVRAASPRRAENARPRAGKYIQCTQARNTRACIYKRTQSTAFLLCVSTTEGHGSRARPRFSTEIRPIKPRFSFLWDPGGFEIGKESKPNRRGTEIRSAWVDASATTENAFIADSVSRRDRIISGEAPVKAIIGCEAA